MNVYTTEKIRNVVLLGHSGCGKTSLVEAMAYLAGQTTRMGTVADGSTISDFDKEEIKRQFSIHTSVVPIEWDNVKINILDTPGFLILWERLKKLYRLQMLQSSWFQARQVYRQAQKEHGRYARNTSCRG